MSVLVDTNVLLRQVQRDHPNNNAAFASVDRFLERGWVVYFASQTMSELWNVLTRPKANNGFGLAPASALIEVEKIEETLTVLPDTPAIYPEWKRLVSLHAVVGVKVHDARLVAAMNVHGVSRLLTFNARDFGRYGIEVLHPLAVAT